MARKTKAETHRELLDEAKSRFKRAEDWESDTRIAARDDQRFVWGDSHNNYQWDSGSYVARTTAGKPTLTINRTSVLCDAVINEIKNNPPQIKIIPTGDRASYEGAQVMLGITKYIEYNSDAQNIYKRAAENMVHVGWGYWRLCTDYRDDDTDDQDLYMRPINDPFSVYMDPSRENSTGYGAEWAFIFTELPEDEFKRLYPDVEIRSNNWGERTWCRTKTKTVRVAEYFRRRAIETNLVLYTDDQGGTESIREDILKQSEQVYDAIMARPDTRTRPLTYHKVEWFKIAGDEIVEEGDWVGEHIPIIRCCAKESVIDGILNVKGHVRNLKDPQRMYNYWTSSAAEVVSYQSKSPWVGPAKAIENFQNYWANANSNPPAYLPYNHLDDKGMPIPPPQRADGPEMPQAYIAGMQMAAEEIRMVSGQPKADLGEVDDSRSGIAVKQVRQAAEICTSHFQDALDAAVQAAGRMVLAIIPKLYDTKRVIKIMGEDMKPTTVMVDPQYRQEFAVHEQQDQARIDLIFNPGFAKYEVQAKSGPGYATRREAAFEAMMPLMADPRFMSIAGDIVFEAADFPKADQLADRFRRAAPPEVFGALNPEIKQQMDAKDQQIQALTEQNQALVTEARRDYIEKKEKELDKQIDQMKAMADQYRAVTDRLKVLQPATPLDEQTILAEQTVENAASAPLG